MQSRRILSTSHHLQGFHDVVLLLFNVVTEICSDGLMCSCRYPAQDRAPDAADRHKDPDLRYKDSRSISGPQEQGSASQDPVRAQLRSKAHRTSSPERIYRAEQPRSHG